MHGKTLHKAGFWAVLMAFLAMIGYDVTQSLQIIGVLGKPRDEIFIYGSSLFIAIPFMLTLLSLHYLTPEIKPRLVTATGSMLFLVLFSWARSVGA